MTPDDAERPSLVGGRADNVVLVQTSSTTWEVRVSDSDEVVGTVERLDARFVALGRDGAVLGDYDSHELAMIGVVSRG